MIGLLGLLLGGVIIQPSPSAGVLSYRQPSAAAAGTCGTNISVIQSTGIRWNASITADAIFNSPVTAGHTIYVAVATFQESVQFSTQVSDNKGNTYTNVLHNSPAGATTRVGIWQAANITNGGSNFAVNFRENFGNAFAFAAIEVEGTACAGTTDGTDTQDGTGTNATTTNITTTARDLLLGVISRDSGNDTTTFTKGATYTQIYNDNDNANFTAINVQYKIVDAGTYNANWTLSASETWHAAMAAFK